MEQYRVFRSVNFEVHYSVNEFTSDTGSFPQSPLIFHIEVLCLIKILIFEYKFKKATAENCHPLPTILKKIEPMTLIISWIGVDDKKDGKEIASIYISSDSRYTWGNLGEYDYGIKVFGSTKFPEIFGFCGDVLFPSTILGQVIPQIDNGILLNNSDNAEIKSNKIFSYIVSSLESYPKAFIGDNFTILHGTRFEKTFKLFKYYLGADKKLHKEEIPLGNISTKVFSGGSGANEFDKNWLKWEREKHNDYRTSRAVYHCLYKTLKDIKDSRTGGLPQIVGLYRIDNARLFGIVENEKKYIYGKESSEDINSLSIEWRNENFERMNPETLKIFEGAQRQPS